MVLQILVQIFLILLNAVFASAEIAVISMNDTRLERLAKDGNKKAVKLSRLTAQPARFLATIQVAITLAGFLGSAFAADHFSDLLTDWLLGLGVPISRSVLDTASVIVITLLLSYITLIFGELVPKRAAMKNAEGMALALSPLVYGISKLFAPIVSMLTFSTNAILRLMGIDPNSEDDQVTEEEIRMMVDEGSERGAIDQEEKELIQNVFEFDDLSVEEIATHRTEVSLLWMDETVEQWEQTIHQSRHSLYPVCDESVDRVVGILNAKDYFRLSSKTKERILEKAVRPAYFVPDYIKADVLFRNMKQTGNYFAVVLDEYGGMSGIVTMNDLVQRLVGDFDDSQAEDNSPEIERLDSGTWKIKGSAELEEVAGQLGITLKREDCETFGGFVFSALGSVPADGSVFELDAQGLHIKVTEIRGHRLIRAVVAKLPEEKGIDKQKDL